jgi:hypothetical protein
MDFRIKYSRKAGHRSAHAPKAKSRTKSLYRSSSSKLRRALYFEASQALQQNDELIPQTYWDELFERAYDALDKCLACDQNNADWLCILEPI